MAESVTPRVPKRRVQLRLSEEAIRILRAEAARRVTTPAALVEEKIRELGRPFGEPIKVPV